MTDARGLAPLAPGRADVWLVDVRDAHFLALADRGLATSADRARARAMTDPENGRRLLARRGALRLILARYVETAAESLPIVIAPGGKPVLAHGPAFSVAHSGALYAVAVAQASSVGVDVEQERSVSRAAAIADRWFSSEEARALASVREADREHEFFRLWCAKEALAKRHGAGLRLMKGRGETADGALDVGDWLRRGGLRYFDPGSGYVGALASTGPVDEITIIHPTEELWTTSSLPRRS